MARTSNATTLVGLLTVIALAFGAAACGSAVDPEPDVTPDVTPDVAPDAALESAPDVALESAPSCSAASQLASWLNPTPGPGIDADGLPTEVGGSTDCDYNKFAWQSFLALMRPTADGLRVYRQLPEKWQLLRGKAAYPNQSAVPPDTLVDYVEAGPTPTPLVDQNGEWTYYAQRFNSTAVYYLDACGLTNADCLRAMTIPLGTANEDTPTHPIRYPSGSLELKEAWKVMGDGDDPTRFLTREMNVTPAKAGTEAQAKVTVGLTGFHVVHLTPQNRAWVWGTFEHVDNAPDCADAGGLMGGDAHFSYFDPGCATRCEEKKTAGSYAADTDCSAICQEFNVYHNNGCALDTEPSKGVVTPPKTTLASFPCGGDLQQTCSTSTGCFEGIMKDPDYYAGYKGGANCFRTDVSLSGEAVAAERQDKPGCDASIPTQVCRAWPVGFRGVTDAGEPKIDSTLAPLNAEIEAALGSSSEQWAHVLANYRLVGVQWGQPKESGVDPIWSEEINLEGDPTLINVTLEAYIQGGELPTTYALALQAFSQGTARGGCLGCHGVASPQFSWNSFNGINFRPWRQQDFSHGLDYLEAPTGDGDPDICNAIVTAARAASEGDPWKLGILAQCPIQGAAE